VNCDRGIKLQYLPYEHERALERLRALEEFALVVINNCSGNSFSKIPERDDLFEWLTTEYQHQLDTLFEEIEDLELQRDSLRNQVNHDHRL